MDKVCHGEKVVITKHGKEVALIIPISSERTIVKSLITKGKAKWSGDKPEGLKGIKIISSLVKLYTEEAFSEMVNLQKNI